MFAHQQVTQLRGTQDRIDAAGARLIIVGPGTPDMVPAFREKTGYTGEVYCDPSGAAYRAAHMKSGWLSTIGLRAIRAGLRARREGAKQTSVQGNVVQQGGVLVIRPVERLLYWYTSRHAGDHPAVDDLLGSLRG